MRGRVFSQTPPECPDGNTLPKWPKSLRLPRRADGCRKSLGRETLGVCDFVIPVAGSYFAYILSSASQHTKRETSHSARAELMNRTPKLQRVKSLPPPPARPEDANKGTFGRVLVVAGSRGMSGAACLAGLGALRGGAGLVTIAAPAGILPIVAAVEPSYLTLPMPEDATGKISQPARSRSNRPCGHRRRLRWGPDWVNRRG